MGRVYFVADSGTSIDMRQNTKRNTTKPKSRSTSVRIEVLCKVPLIHNQLMKNCARIIFSLGKKSHTRKKNKSFHSRPECIISKIGIMQLQGHEKRDPVINS